MKEFILGEDEVRELLDLCEDNDVMKVAILGWVASKLEHAVADDDEETNYLG